MAIFELHVSVRDQNSPEFHQEHTYDNTKVKQDKMDALKLKKYTFQGKKGPKNIFFPIFWGFDNSSQYQYGKGVNNTLTFCLCLFLNLDHGSGQVCSVSFRNKVSWLASFEVFAFLFWSYVKAGWCLRRVKTNRTFWDDLRCICHFLFLLLIPIDPTGFLRYPPFFLNSPNVLSARSVDML